MIDLKIKNIDYLFFNRTYGNHYIALKQIFNPFSMVYEKGGIVSCFGSYLYNEQSRDLDFCGFVFSDNIKECLYFNSYEECVDFIKFKLKISLAEIKKQNNINLIVREDDILDMFQIFSEDELMIKEIIE